ncbi:hypothetical protein J6590_042090 [Homalodisca vitripennis]|nr:hypothetical protein J6590_042090 [Homalodisca vitripennis]
MYLTFTPVTRRKMATNCEIPRRAIGSFVNIKDKLLLGTTVIAEEHCNSVASPHARARQLIDNGIVIMGSRGDQGVAHLHFHIPSKCSALHQLFLSRSRSRDNQRLLRCQSAVTLVHLG